MPRSTAAPSSRPTPSRQRMKRNPRLWRTRGDVTPCSGVSAQTWTWQSMIMRLGDRGVTVVLTSRDRQGAAWGRSLAVAARQLARDRPLLRRGLFEQGLHGPIDFLV